MTGRYDLISLPTRVLLKYLRGAKKKQGLYCLAPGRRAISKSDIKAELQKRKPAPNKPEAREVRYQLTYRDQARLNWRKKLKKRRGY